MRYLHISLLEFSGQIRGVIWLWPGFHRPNPFLLLPALLGSHKSKHKPHPRWQTIEVVGHFFPLPAGPHHSLQEMSKMQGLLSLLFLERWTFDSGRGLISSAALATRGVNSVWVWFVTDCEMIIWLGRLTILPAVHLKPLCSTECPVMVLWLLSLLLSLWESPPWLGKFCHD